MPESLFKANCIRLYSGVYLNLLHPEPTMIYPIDIAVGLARECRWGNHSKKFYSVAEHSIECMNMAGRISANPHLPFQCLMHDAHEAYLKDIPSPLKKMIPEYRAIAERVQRAICTRFGIGYPFRPEVKDIDEIVLEDEWNCRLLRWSGLEMDERSRVDLFLHHLVKLCRHPIPIMP